MALKKPVAVERRIDLASLFCLIARHGPAVLVTLVVIGCSLAGFIMFRNMREKRRRRRRRRAGSSERDDRDAGRSRDAALGLGEGEELCAEEPSRSGSTDGSDEEQDYRSHVRHRSAAPERNPDRDSPPDGDTAVNKLPFSFFWHSYSPKATESHVDETRYDSERNLSHTSPEDVTDEVYGAKEPVLMNDVGFEEKEKATEADSSEDVTSTTDDVSEEEFTQEEETVPFAFNAQLCSAPTHATLCASDGGEYSGEAEVRQEHEVEADIVPEITSAPPVEECSDQAAVTHLNREQQADVPRSDDISSTTSSVEITEEDFVKTCHNDTCESERLDNSCGLASAPDVNVVAAALTSNSHRQNEPLMSPSLDTEIDQNGLCPQALSRFETDIDPSCNQNDAGLVKEECPEATGDGCSASNVAAASRSLHTSVEDGASLDQQEMTESATQNQQRQEITAHAQGDNQTCKDQKEKAQEENETLAICEENNVNLTEQKEGLNVDFKHQTCSVHPPESPSPPHEDEVMKVETSPTGLGTNDGEEISAVTDTAAQTKYDKPLEGPSDFLPLPPQISENESDQTCREDASVDETNISASTRDKLENMVEQMVAEAYKDVTQTSLEAPPTQLEVKASNSAQEDEGIAPDNLHGTGVEREVVISSNATAQSLEENLNSVSCQSDISKVEELEKCSVSDASENQCSKETSNDGGIIPVTEAVSSPQDGSRVEEERAERLTDKNVENEIPVPEGGRVHQTVVDVQSTQLEQNTSEEQLDEMTVQQMQECNNTVHDTLDEEEVEVVEQETCTKEGCCNLDTRMQSTVCCPEPSDAERAEDEKEIQSGVEGGIVENGATSSQSEPHGDQREPDERSDVSNNAEDLLENGDGAQESPSSVETEDPESKAAVVDVQSEHKESGGLLDTRDQSKVTAKSGKVVILCRTVEAGVSTVEMSDSEDFGMDGDIPDLEPTSCQDHIEINRNPANGESCADVVASSDDALTAQTVIEETAAEENPLTQTGRPRDFSSGVTLDIPQDGGVFVKSSERIKQQDEGPSTPGVESGICSMTVSPEKEELALNKVIGQDTLTTCQVRAEDDVLTRNGDATVGEEDPSAVGITIDELSLTNEDLFGSEIEDGYNTATEQLMTQVVDNIKSPGTSLTKTVEETEKKERACAASKENEEKVESEKTEINIMEATMDHNEWITDGNYQVLPWMAAASFSKDPSGSKETKDAAESKPQAASVEEGADNAKKVLAVQPMPQNVNVTFRVHYVTLSPYQTLAVIGDQPELGAWKSVVPLEKAKDGYWTCVVGLPAESHVQWKFVVLEKGEVCRWEECGNRLLYTGFSDDLLVHKWWGIL